MIRPSPEKVGKLGDKIGGVLKYGYPQIIPNWTNLVLKVMVFWATESLWSEGWDGLFKSLPGKDGGAGPCGLPQHSRLTVGPREEKTAQS